MKRAIGAIFTGLIAAIVLIGGISFAAHSMYAPAQPIDPNWGWAAGIVIVVVTALVAVRSALPARGSAA